ncbi:hypothetical protein BABINDRAFT_38831 [Babjeviella inositovora NRRL Y-12698]|uniref:Flavodoxin-like domain-containing protein n=1 Tax=Babjeviella inositovora NRRL Y-12698 TaxID=984486 RepID=A0A1E3QMB3_9ASCO|nr:uncharacterized protein BABINDRAFT_38831 [Babjeviella inositovora NRRL Y-12698]ODQ78825.1 hypothetical protein BABINDRAFT_38831 [Babjeviella inositovora NRRL Y-12698]
MKIAIIQYSTYGHITTLAEAVAAGIRQAAPSVQVDLFQVPETLTPEVLAAIHAPEKPTLPLASTATLVEYDAFVFGVPTRFGTMPAQWSTFWDTTGGLWGSGALHGKPVSLFVSTGSQGGGQETTVRSFLSTITHHGMVYVPLGYKTVFGDVASLEEIRGGSPYGAGMFAGVDGSRVASGVELKVAEQQGRDFAVTAAKFVSADSAADAAKAAPIAEQKAVQAESAAPVAAAEPKAEARAKQSAPAAASEKKSSGCCVIV